MSAQYSAAFQVSSTATVNAFATANGSTASAVASAAYTITSDAFTVKADTASSDDQLLERRRTSTIMVAPPSGGSFNSAVALTCAVTGTGTLPTCSLSPSSVTPGTQGATSTLTVSVPASAMAPSPPRCERHFDWPRISDWKIVGWSGSRLVLASSLAILLLSLLVSLRFQRKLRPRYAWLAAALFLALLQTACGGGGGGVPTPRPRPGSQTYTVTVTGVSTTANSVKIQQTATITVTVP